MNNGFVRFVNTRVAALIASPRWGRLLGRSFAIISYTGRRSGKTFTTPINYQRRGNEIVIGVAMAGRKNWWRNFIEPGAPLSIRIDGADLSGHAVAHRSPRGAVSVRLMLD
jgi:hypothetical protein